MNLIEADARLIALCETQSWRCEYRWPWLDCFCIARVLFAGAYALATAMIILVWLDYFPTYPWTISLCCVLGVGGVWQFMDWTVRDISKSVKNKPGVSNSVKTQWPGRLPVHGVWIVSVEFVLWTPITSLWAMVTFLIFAILALLAAYFYACNPMPPKWEPRAKLHINHAVTDLSNQ